jgi:Uma2 family endonuclease
MEVLVKQKGKKRRMTYARFRDMEIPDGDTSIYELINGQIVKRASPNSPHQEVSGNLFLAIGNFIKKKKLGKLYAAALDVYFDEETAGVQPDLLFVSKDREFIIHENNGIVGAPDLVIEIVSPGSVDKDRSVKKDVYERFAVKEYWIVDPAYQSIEVYRMVDDRYQLFSFAEREGKVKSTVLPGFELEVKKVFQ